MVSALRKNKLNYVFDTFFDINRDGSIEKSDFELAVGKSRKSEATLLEMLNTRTLARDSSRSGITAYPR